MARKSKEKITWKVAFLVAVFMFCLALVLMPLTWGERLTATAYRNLTLQEFRLEALDSRIDAAEKVLGMVTKIKNLRLKECKF